jgi:hypothetical protein
MLVLVFVRHPEVKADRVQEVGIGHFHSYGFEVVAYMINWGQIPINFWALARLIGVRSRLIFSPTSVAL